MYYNKNVYNLDSNPIILPLRGNLMFDKIQFLTVESKRHLTSNRVSEETLKKGDYNAEALVDTNFSIWGSVDAFRKPPISDFAMKNLYYMKDFDVFHYRYDSFTERKNFHSFLILYTYSGKGSLNYKGRKYSLSTGDGFFINCMDYHLYQVEDQSWDTGVLHIYGPLLPAFHEQYMQHGSPVFHEAISGKYQQYLEQLLELYSTPQLYRDWQVSTCIDNILNYLLLLSSQQVAMLTEIPENIRYMIKFMENNINKNLSLDYMADLLNISKYYLSREFKKYTGFSPIDFLISLRINHAKMLLKSSKIPATKIAHEVGIHDLNNFINLFKRKTGMTPIQYRNSSDVLTKI